MRELLTDAGIEIAGLLLTAIGSAAFTLLGVVTEQAGVQNALAGQTTVGAWEMGIGLLALFVGVYLLGYGELLPRLRTLHTRER